MSILVIFRNRPVFPSGVVVFLFASVIPAAGVGAGAESAARRGRGRWPVGRRLVRRGKEDLATAGTGGSRRSRPTGTRPACARRLRARPPRPRSNWQAGFTLPCARGLRGFVTIGLVAHVTPPRRVVGRDRLHQF